MQILIYDDKEMHVFEVLSFIPDEIKFEEFDISSLEDYSKKVVMVPHIIYTASIHIGEQLAELDPTTMKRIARYNLEKENEELLEEIKQRKVYLGELNEEFRNLSDRLERIKEVGADIWENGTEYCSGNECDYE